MYSSHLRNSYSARLGDPGQVNLLSALALAVLLIACFNYMNLSTARAQLRFREVGINKTMGASRRQLASRFYMETTILVGVSLALAVIGFVVSLQLKIGDLEAGAPELRADSELLNGLLNR